MWRRADLHVHARPVDRGVDALDAAAVARQAADRGIEVIGITDHDTVEAVAEVAGECQDIGIVVVPGVELTTDRGHLLCYAPGDGGLEILQALLARTGAWPDHEVPCDEVLKVIAREPAPNGRSYAEQVVTVAAHAERDRSLLAGGDSATSRDQLKRVANLDAVEVTDPDVAEQWIQQGIKSSDVHLPVIVSSDAHAVEAIGSRWTWLHVPESINVSGLRQALATPESSLQIGGDRPDGPSFVIRRIRIEGGLHDGLDLALHPRINAVIGPPSVGKSLLIDAIRDAFSDPCVIPEIAQITESRKRKQLPDGSRVIVDLVLDGQEQQIVREVGGQFGPTTDARPIVFSQQELMRRAMDPSPDLELIDLHATSLAGAKAQFDEAQALVGEHVRHLISLAHELRALATGINHPVDGLEATQTKIKRLAPARDLAERVQALRSAAAWRERVLGDLLRGLTVETAEVELAAAPTEAGGHDDAAAWIKRAEAVTLLEDFREEVGRMTEQYQQRARELLGQDEQLTTAIREAEERLTDAIQGGDGQVANVLDHLRTLQERQAQLLADVEQRKVKQEQMQTGLERLRAAVEGLQATSDDILAARKQACREVNEHIRGFHCRVTADDVSERLQHVRQLRTGLHEATLAAYCHELDALRVVTDVVTAVAAGHGSVEGADERDPHVRCVDKIIERQEWELLSQLTCCRADETLHIEQQHGQGAEVTPFGQMTEGERALAIKELSFAASSRPVVTDQPEDAVATRNVFDDLVPTLRKQRTARQFIVVSHDANIVVGTDADHIIVLGNVPAREGNLYDPAISQAALEHLEGGVKAFERRRRRYQQLRGLPSDADQ